MLGWQPLRSGTGRMASSECEVPGDHRHRIYVYGQVRTPLLQQEG